MDVQGPPPGPPEVCLYSRIWVYVRRRLRKGRGGGYVMGTCSGGLGRETILETETETVQEPAEHQCNKRRTLHDKGTGTRHMCV